MEELTIEQKARRYDEAIERAKQWEKSPIVCSSNDICQKLFPELKESEDERIIKELIQFFSDKDEEDYEGMHPRAQILAWLEKQCEQKSKFRVGDTIKCKYDDRRFTIKSVDLDKGTYTYTQEGCGNDIDYADKEFELVGQKPAWSEEDDAKLKSILFHIEDVENKDIINWLKSLEYRVQPQPKQEWSEEDEKHYQGCLNLMKLSLDTKPYPYYNDYLWLKSLKERYTWKPSDEQIIELHRVISGCSYDIEPLVELETKLKKL